MVIECDFIEPIDNWFTASGGHTIDYGVNTSLNQIGWWHEEAMISKLTAFLVYWRTGCSFGKITDATYRMAIHSERERKCEAIWGSTFFFLRHIWPLLMAVMLYIKWGWRRFAKAMVIILHPAGAYPIEWPIWTTPFCNSPERIDRNAYVRCLLTLSMK